MSEASRKNLAERLREKIWLQQSSEVRASELSGFAANAIEYPFNISPNKILLWINTFCVLFRSAFRSHFYDIAVVLCLTFPFGSTFTKFGAFQIAKKNVDHSENGCEMMFSKSISFAVNISTIFLFFRCISTVGYLRCEYWRMLSGLKRSRKKIPRLEQC